MIQYYKTLQHYGAKELIIKKSRFIGHASPVASEEEAVRFVEQIQKEHRSATHNCWAYVAGERDEYQKQSDDGEPSGTAGKPILEVIKSQQLKHVAIVVTRYFGGIMLGAGGLIRAYTDGAVAGSEAAEPVWQVLHREVSVTIDYHWLGKLENELHLRGIARGETAFTDKVTLTCLPLAGEAEALVLRLTDLTQGQCELVVGAAFYQPHSELPVSLR